MQPALFDRTIINIPHHTRLPPSGGSWRAATDEGHSRKRIKCLSLNYAGDCHVAALLAMTYFLRFSQYLLSGNNRYIRRLEGKPPYSHQHCTKVMSFRAQSGNLRRNDTQASTFTRKTQIIFVGNRPACSACYDTSGSKPKRGMVKTIPYKD